MNTWFKNHMRRRWAWMSLWDISCNQIDYNTGATELGNHNLKQKQNIHNPVKRQRNCRLKTQRKREKAWYSLKLQLDTSEGCKHQNTVCIISPEKDKSARKGHDSRGEMRTAERMHTKVLTSARASETLKRTYKEVADARYFGREIYQELDRSKKKK